MSTDQAGKFYGHDEINHVQDFTLPILKGIGLPTVVTMSEDVAAANNITEVDEINAFAHGWTTLYMTKKYGPEYTNNIGKSKEKFNSFMYSLKNKTPELYEDSVKDSFNNLVGFKMALYAKKNGLSLQELPQLAKDQLNKETARDLNNNGLIDYNEYLVIDDGDARINSVQSDYLVGYNLFGFLSRILLEEIINELDEDNPTQGMVKDLIEKSLGIKNTNTDEAEETTSSEFTKTENGNDVEYQTSNKNYLPLLINDAYIETDKTSTITVNDGTLSGAIIINQGEGSITFKGEETSRKVLQGYVSINDYALTPDVQEVDNSNQVLSQDYFSLNNIDGKFINRLGSDLSSIQFGEINTPPIDLNPIDPLPLMIDSSVNQVDVIQSNLQDHYTLIIDEENERFLENNPNTDSGSFQRSTIDLMSVSSNFLGAGLIMPPSLNARIIQIVNVESGFNTATWIELHRDPVSGVIQEKTKRVGSHSVFQSILQQTDANNANVAEQYNNYFNDVKAVIGTSYDGPTEAISYNFPTSDGSIIFDNSFFVKTYPTAYIDSYGFLPINSSLSNEPLIEIEPGVLPPLSPIIFGNPSQSSNNQDYTYYQGGTIYSGAAYGSIIRAQQYSILPLIVDLDGDGVETIGYGDSSVFFDMEGSGFKVRTGWAGKDDGQLAYDLNSNGKIDDISELFGGTRLGFDHLSDYDSNSDGVINSSDTDFANLKVWQDLNEDGITDAGELKTLSEHNITSIDLDGVEDLYETLDNGNEAVQRSTFTYSGGATGEIVDIGFLNNPSNAIYGGDYQIDLDTANLPWLRGSGVVKDLLHEASGNEELKQTIREFAFITDAKVLYNYFDNLLAAWAGVDDVDANATRGPIKEWKAQLLGKFFNQDIPTTLDDRTGGFFELSYIQLKDKLFVDFISQTDMGQDLGLSYDFVINDVSVDTNIYDNLIQNLRDPSTEFNTYVTAKVLASVGKIDITDLETKVTELGYGQVLVDYLNGDSSLFQGQGVDTTQGLLSFQETLLSGSITDTFGNNWQAYGNAAIESTNGWKVDENHLTLDGSTTMLQTTDLKPEGNEYTIRWRQRFDDFSGYQTLINTDSHNGVGMQAFLSGSTVNLEASSNGSSWNIMSSTVALPSATANQWYEFEFSYSNVDGYKFFIDGDLKLSTTNTEAILSPKGITLGAGWSGNSASRGAIADVYVTKNEVLHTANFTPSPEPFEPPEADFIKADDNSNIITGSALADDISGGDGNDYIRGDQGADDLKGGLGDDTYLFNVGDGNDTIQDNEGTNTVVFGQGINVSDLSIIRVTDSGTASDDLEIRLNYTGQTLTIKNWFTDSNAKMNSFVFATEQSLDGGTTESYSLSTTQIESLLASEYQNTSTITGTSGDDEIINIDDATISSLGGNDTIVNYGQATIDAGAGDDNIISNTADDIIKLSDGFGEDSLIDVGGVNTLDLNNLTSAVTIDLGDNEFIASAGNTLTWNEQGLTNVIGTSGHDDITGDEQNNNLTGGTGNDSLAGGSGDDTYAFGVGFGTDNITETSGSDTLDFSDFGSALSIDLSTTSVVASAGNTVTWATDAIENAVGTAGNDTITGNADDNTLAGGAGNDSLVGAGGDDTYVVSASGGLDTISDASGSNTIDTSNLTNNVTTDLSGTSFVESAGNTVTWGSGDLVNAISGDGNDTLTGDSNANQLTGGLGDDSLIGAGGNDTYILQSSTFGNDTITDTSGSNILDLSQWSTDATVDLSTTSMVASEGNTLTWDSNGLSNVLVGRGDDSLTGNSSANTLTGNDGNDTLVGGAGNDSLIGGDDQDIYQFADGFGLDTINDSDGFDQLDVSNLTGNVAVDLSSTSFVASAGNTVTWTADTLEAVVSGDGNDSLTGNSDDNWLSAGDGSNVLVGGTGDDTLEGGSGNDEYNSFSSSSGADVIRDGGGSDSANFGTLNTTDGTWILNDNDGDGQIDGLTIDFGSGHSVTIDDYFDDLSTTLGSAGQGTGVIESLVFNDDSDVTFSEAVALATPAIGTAGNDTISGTNFDDSLVGNDGADDLSGLNGNDTLTGGAGNDTLTGGLGNDSLVGGADNDTYVIGSASFGKDTINDTVGTNTLDLSALTNNLSVNLADSVFVSGFGNTVTWGAGDITNLITGDGADLLQGDSGDNILQGGDGNDTYNLGTAQAGLDTITDTEGVNTLSFVDYGTAVSANLTSNSFVESAGNTVTWTGSSLDNLIGSSGHDTLTGNSNDNQLDGGSGDDTYILLSSFGEDSITDLTGSNTVDASSFGTALTINLTGSSFVESAGNTLTWTNGTLDNVITGSGNDSLTASNTSNALTGGLGNDSYAGLSKTGGTDLINDVGGTETVTFSGTNTTDGSWQALDTDSDGNVNDLKVDFGNGHSVTFSDYFDDTDQLSTNSGQGAGFIETLTFDDDASVSFSEAQLLASGIFGTAAADTLTGSSGDDDFYGLAGDDSMTGSGGADRFYQADDKGKDTIDGGAGTDTVNYSELSGGVRYYTDNDQVVVNSALDELTNVEALIGSATETTDKVYGVFNSAALNVDLSNNTITGADGTITSLTNFEQVVGSEYNDTITGSTADNWVNGQGGADSIVGNAGSDTLLGASGNDTLSGGNDDDWLDGGLDNDLLQGDAGDDTLMASLGDDTLEGGVGDDLYTGFDDTTGTDIIDDTSGTDDSLVFGTSHSNEVVVTAIDTNSDTYVDDLKLDFWGGHSVQVDDYFDNTSEYAGTSGAGAGFIEGISFTDVSDADFNRVVELINRGTSGADDFVGTSADDYISGAAGNDTLSGLGDDDYLAGGDGDDSLIGGDGNDILDGGTGQDTLNGGAGNDTYVFTQQFGNDSIVDSGGTDTIDFSALDEAVDFDLGESAYTHIPGSGTQDTNQSYLRFEGIDGSTTLTDLFDNSWSAQGGADIGSGTPWKTGEKHVDIDASGDYIKTTAMVPAGNNFTIRWRQRLDGFSGIQHVLDGHNGDIMLLRYEGTSLKLYLSSSPANFAIANGSTASTTSWTADQWYDFEFSYDSTHGYRVFVDGNLEIDVTNTTALSNPGGLTLGARHAGDYTALGAIADVYFTNTETLNTSSFTPKTNPYVANEIDWSSATIENVIGSTLDDTVVGDTGANVIDGFDGNDSLSGDSGNDTLYGSDGNDTLQGNAGNDQLEGGADDDTYLIESGFGLDTIDDSVGQNTLDLSNFASSITFDLSDTSFVESAGNTITWTAGDIANVIGGSGNNTLLGDANDNVLTGNTGNDSLVGAAGDDTYILGSTFGQDTINDTSGSDTLDLSAQTINISLDTNSTSYTDGTNTVTWGSGQIENFATGSGNDSLTGDAGSNTLSGGTGNDDLDGAAGDDRYIFVDNMGLDTVTDSAGSDTLDFVGVTTGVDVNLNNTSYVESAGNTVIWTGSTIENLASGSGNDTLTSNSSDNHLEGRDGDDDYVFLSGFGNDTIADNAGFDTLDLSAFTNSLSINLSNGFFVQSTGNTITWNDSLLEKIVGGSGSDSLTGNASNNYLTGTILVGEAGNDTLTGGSGDDLLDGGADNDSLTGAAGNDEYRFDDNFGEDVISDSAGTDTLNFSNLSTSIVADLTSSTIVQGSNTITLGSSVIENIIGGDANDTLIGTSAANELTGGAGNDVLTGGAGDDRYLFLDGFGTDQVTDSAGSDTLDFSGISDAITVNLNNTQASVATGTVTWNADTIENVTGGSGNDTLIGNSDGNALAGGLGDDTYQILAEFGSDTITDSSGNNVLDLSAFDDGITVDLTENRYTALPSGGSSSDQSYLRFEGADSSTTLTDLFGNSWSAYGGAEIGSGTPWKSNEKQVDIDASGDYIKSTAMVPSGSNYTLRWRQRLDSFSGIQYLLDGNNGDVMTMRFENNNLKLYLSTSPANFAIANGATASTTSWTADQWYDFEFSYDSTHGYRVFVDGNLEIDVTNTSALYSPGGIILGSRVSANYTALGAIADVYFTNTETLNTSSFTPLDAPYLANDIQWNSGAITDLTTGDGDDVITGTSANNRLISGLGDDSLDGAAGDDTYVFENNFGNDTIADVSGSDTLDFAAVTSNLTVDLTTTSMTVSAGNTVTWASGVIDNIIDGLGNDSLTGTSGDNKLTSGAGNDTLTGGAGNDTYSFLGSFGIDSISDSAGTDTLDLSQLTTGLSVDLSSTALTDGTNSITWNSGALENVVGTQGNDTLTGDSGANIITGGAGNDSLIGGTGNDTYHLSLGDGLDTITDTDAGTNTDTAIFGNDWDDTDIAFFMNGDNLEIGYLNNNNDGVTIVNQGLAAANEIEQFELSSGDYLTAADVDQVIQDMSTYATNNSVAFTSLQDVKNNEALMNIITSGWNAAA